MVDRETQRNLNTGVSWLALIIAVIALFFATAAFNRSGEDIQAVFQQESRRTVREAQETAGQIEARARAEASLREIREDIETGTVGDQTTAQLEDVREDLENAYAEADSEVKAGWQDLDNNLSQLETQLRQNTASALATLEQALASLRQDTLTENR